MLIRNIITVALLIGKAMVEGGIRMAKYRFYALNLAAKSISSILEKLKVRTIVFSEL